MKKRTDKLKAVPVLLTDDLTDEMLIHSRELKVCRRRNVGSISAYARVAIIEKLKRGGTDMSKVSSVYGDML